MHVIEPATSGRAKCRGCGDAIAKGELRFGERQPNPYADGEMTLWFHPWCAAYKRPEPFLALLATPPDADADLPYDLDAMLAAAKDGIAHRRLPRVDGAERAPTGRARCRSCRETIPKDAWRIRLTYFEEARFNPSGFIHAACAHDYLDTADLVDRARHFAPALTDEDAAALTAALATD